MDYCFSCHLFGQCLHVVLAVMKGRTTSIKREGGNLLHLHLDAVSNYLPVFMFTLRTKTLKNNIWKIATIGTYSWDHRPTCIREDFYILIWVMVCKACLSEDSHGQGCLAGYSPGDCKESDTTEATKHPQTSLVCRSSTQWSCLQSRWVSYPLPRKHFGCLCHCLKSSKIYFFFHFKDWRARQPIPLFLPGESPGQSGLPGYSPWGHKELGMTELT